MKAIKSICRRTFRFKNFIRLHFLFCISMFICACTPPDEDPNSNPGTMTRCSKGFGYTCHIMEFKMDGVTHEYLTYDRGICHYPECKYCKENK